MAKKFRTTKIPSVFPLALALFLAAMLLAAGGAAAQGSRPVGELVLTKGVVKIRSVTGREAVVTDIGRRFAVRVGDVVQSGRDTKATIFFRDEREKVSLYSNTQFKIEELSPRRTWFALSIGKAFFAAIAGVRRNTFNVRTATATIGVKGTEFVVGTDGESTFLLTIKGLVTMVNPEFPDVVVEVGASQASTVRANQQPTPPVDVAPEDMETIVAQDGNEAFEAVVPPPAASGGASEGASEEGEEEEAEEEKTEEAEPVFDTSAATDLVEEVIDIVQDSAGEAAPSGDAVSAGPVNITITR